MSRKRHSTSGTNPQMFTTNMSLTARHDKVHRGMARFMAPVVIALVAALLVSNSARAADDKSYDWNSDTASVASAESIARECLKQDNSYQWRFSCILKPSSVCQSQYQGGRANQRDHVECAGFSAAAWDRIVDDIYSRLMQSGNFPAEFSHSQSMWKSWNEFDCEVGGRLRIGSMSPLNYSGCRVTHAGARAIELMYMLLI